MESSFSILGFTEQLNNLRHVHSSIKSLINTRLRSISKRKGETTAQLRKYVIVATTNLVKQIEIAPFMNPDIDYSSLFNELNQLITEYKNLINKRVLFNKERLLERLISKVLNPPNLQLQNSWMNRKENDAT